MCAEAVARHFNLIRRYSKIRRNPEYFQAHVEGYGRNGVFDNNWVLKLTSAALLGPIDDHDEVSVLKDERNAY